MRTNRRSSILGGAVLVVLLAAACGGTAEAPAPATSASRNPAPRGVADRVAAVLATDSTFDSVRAVLVSVDGRTVLEEYHGSTPQEHRNVFSITKSVMAILVGAAVAEGRIPGTGATLAELLPTYARAMTPAVARTTLEQVLTMRGGFVGEEDPEGFAFMGAPDPTRAILDAATDEDRGHFVYSDAGAHLVSAVITAATGRSALEYARSRLFGPLGIDTRPATEPVITTAYTASPGTGFAWYVDRRGHHTGWSGLSLTPRDLLALGRLFLDEGRAPGGGRVVPAAWVREVTTGRVRLPENPPIDGAYGYEWWTGELRGHREYGAVGYGGQRITVVPDLGAVVVVATEADVADPASGIDPRDSARIVEEAVIGLGER